MKITRLVENKNRLVEADAAEVELGELNPQTASVDDLADAIQDAIEDASNNEVEISDADATAVAIETKATATGVGAGQVVIDDSDFEDTEVKNALTEALDESLEAAQRYFRRSQRGRNQKGSVNILVEGLPGSGKTAIVESWCNARGLTLVAINATDPKLETSISGMPLRDVTVTDANKVARVRDDVLDKLLNSVHPELAGKCILFVDEFNRQKQDQLRRPLMSLFNEKRNADGTVDVSKNLLFSVICINPSGLKFKDKGTVEPNDAEHNRFLATLRDFDSNAEDSLHFFEGWHKKQLLDLGIIPPGSVASRNHGGFVGPTRELSADELEDAKEYIRIYALAVQILTHPEFEFDTRETLDMLDKGEGLRRQLLTARLLTDLLNAAGGDKNRFLRRIDTTADLIDSKTEMFHTILDSYIMDTRSLYKKYKLEDPATGATTDEENITVSRSVDDEDDEELFGSSAAAIKNVKSAATTEQEILNIVDQW